MMQLSIALPCYNEEQNIEQTVTDVCAWLDVSGVQGEIVAVDDGSTDETRARLTGLAVREPRLRVVVHERNLGYGAAVRSGLDAATLDWIGFMDSDGQFRASDFDKLIPYAREADVVTGRRFKRADPIVRRLNAKGFGLLNRLFFGVRVHDINCAMKMIRRSRWPEIRPSVTGGALFNLELFARVKKHRVVWRQVFVNHYPRSAGVQTGANPAVLLRALREMFILRWKLWF
jgi:glycosyltransferase involved in cell wall biosynthesis